MSDHEIDISSDAMFELSLATSLCEVVDSPRSLAVALMLRAGEFGQYMELSIDPSNYEDHQHFADDYLVTEILRKSPRLPLGIDKRQVAIDNFLLAEKLCKETNDVFFNPKRFITPVEEKVRRIIASVLGELNSKTLERVQSACEHGPGATTAVPGKGSVPCDKFEKRIDLTAQLLPFTRTLLGPRVADLICDRRLVVGNSFTTVPKSAKTDRGICVEPTLNVYLQKGIGKVIRENLKRRLSIDLDSQDRNRLLAQHAQKWELATVDLSMASDSLALGVVHELLDPSWFHLLSICRAEYTKLGEELIPLEKFSSMGNGFTFELESLIFAAIALAVTPVDQHHLVSVFGDDIILPAEHAGALIDTLNMFGFKVNDSKSFLAGRFYESCGSDFFDGQNVRPFYLRKASGDPTPYALKAANSLRLYASRRGYDLGCDARFRSLWLTLYRLIPKKLRLCKVPADMETAGVVMSLKEARPLHAEHYIEGYRVRVMVTRPVYRNVSRRVGAYLLSLLNLERYGPQPAPLGTPFHRMAVRGFMRSWVTKPSTTCSWSSGLDWYQVPRVRVTRY